MLKERPYELSQKLKRMRASRDNLKESNQHKMLQNKKLRDRSAEIAQSKEMWKSRSKEFEKALADQRDTLAAQIEAAYQTAEDEKSRANRERERANLLEVELEEVKKKHKILKALFRR
jgi:regulator of replication initiation timing